MAAASLERKTDFTIFGVRPPAGYLVRRDGLIQHYLFSVFGKLRASYGTYPVTIRLPTIVT
jgi:hypothetical protein